MIFRNILLLAGGQHRWTANVLGKATVSAILNSRQQIKLIR